MGGPLPAEPKLLFTSLTVQASLLKRSSRQPTLTPHRVFEGRLTHVWHRVGRHAPSHPLGGRGKHQVDEAVGDEGAGQLGSSQGHHVADPHATALVVLVCLLLVDHLGRGSGGGGGGGAGYCWDEERLGIDGKTLQCLRLYGGEGVDVCGENIGTWGAHAWRRLRGYTRSRPRAAFRNDQVGEGRGVYGLDGPPLIEIAGVTATGAGGRP